MKNLLVLVLSVLLSFFISACSNNYKEAQKALPNELAIADECRNSNKSFEKDCYDLIAYKNSFAQLRLGILAQKSKDYKEAFQRYQIAKNKGNFYSNSLLADMYNKGLGVNKDSKKVIDLLEDTKDVDPISAFKLSYYYMQEKDFEEAIELLEFAGQNNVKKAQYALYKIYGKGEITKVDIDKSRVWFEKYEDKSNSFIRKIYGI